VQHRLHCPRASWRPELLRRHHEAASASRMRKFLLVTSMGWRSVAQNMRLGALKRRNKRPALSRCLTTNAAVERTPSIAAGLTRTLNISPQNVADCARKTRNASNVRLRADTRSRNRTSRTGCAVGSRTRFDYGRLAVRTVRTGDRGSRCSATRSTTSLPTSKRASYLECVLGEPRRMADRPHTPRRLFRLHFR
jgi:hypothetical protein